MHALGFFQFTGKVLIIHRGGEGVLYSSLFHLLVEKINNKEVGGFYGPCLPHACFEMFVL